MHTSESHNLSERVAGIVWSNGLFDPSQPAWLARAPGRLDLMGGNVDYTGGLVLQFPLRQAVWAAVQPMVRQSIRIFNPGAAEFGWDTTLEVPVDVLGSLQRIDTFLTYNYGAGAQWGRYVLGGFHLLRERYGCFVSLGANVFLASDLPPNRGLASSAALEVANLKAASASVGVDLRGIALAEAAQWVENMAAHSACGIMDQSAVVLGRQDCILPLLCQTCVPFPTIRLPRHLRIWGIDSMAPRSTSGAAYETARAAAFIGYKMICCWEGMEIKQIRDVGIPRWEDSRWSGYLSNLSPSEFRSAYERRLPELMPGGEFLRSFGEHIDPLTAIDPDVCYPVRAAVRYASEENLRIRTAKLLLQDMRPEKTEETLPLLGELLLQSHFAYTECGLGAAACDELVALARRYGFFGAKMTGGGAGGVVAVMGLEDQRDSLMQLATEFAAARGAMPAIFEGSSDGADLCGVEVITTAALAGSC